ncbi:IS66 family insertion sequence element accessory protein TnpA [Clostridium sp.]|uniref:IS66 family insertion sequence element accessory protein TnpA n=1 Tax=Clostridium sp. TaxID=1506 RepID=UPI003D6D89C2
MRSTTEDLLLWEQIINKRSKSGMSVSEWCKNNEISKGKYHYWNHKISKKTKSG